MLIIQIHTYIFTYSKYRLHKHRIFTERAKENTSANHLQQSTPDNYLFKHNIHTYTWCSGTITNKKQLEK